MHTCEIVHPAVKMCTPGAGCTLNFGHCQWKGSEVKAELEVENEIVSIEGRVRHYNLAHRRWFVNVCGPTYQ